MNSVDSKFSIPAQGNSGILVYEYSVRIDKECLPAVWDQIKKSRQLYNSIIAEIRKIFDEMNSFVFSHADASAINLSQEIESLTEKFKNAKERQDEDMMKEIASIRREKRIALSEQLKSVRGKYKSEIQQQFFSRIGKNSKCPTYQLRCDAVNNGLGWGTANRILDAALQAFSDRIKKGVPPLFARGDEKTQDSLRLQFTQAGGVPVESFIKGEHSGLHLNPINGYGKRKYGEFSFRLGTATDAIYATGTCYFNRPLPQNATIATASLVIRRIGKDYKYALQLVTKLPAELKERPVPQQSQRFATVHFGWAMTETGRHVMAIANQADPEAVKLISLPESVSDDYARVENHASNRSKLLTAIVKEVKEFSLKDGADEELVQTLAEIKRLQNMYISQSKLYRLWRLFLHADINFQALYEWHRQDYMLHQAVTHVARSARMRRRDFYREIACELSRSYQVIVIEPLDLKKANTKLNELTGEAAEFNKKSRYGQRLAAIYEAVSAIRNACSKSGSILLELKGEGTVSVCGYCASTDITSLPENSQILQCSACGAVINRKQNGAAVAWQLADPQIDDLSNEARAIISLESRKKREEDAQRRQKMAEARNMAREAREQAITNDPKALAL